MARTRTLEEMRDDAYKLGDQEGFTDRFPADEVTRYINQGVAELWDLLIASNGYTWAGKPWLIQGPVTSITTDPIVEAPTLTGSATAAMTVLVKMVAVMGPDDYRISWSPDGSENFVDENLIALPYEPCPLGRSGLAVTVAFSAPYTVGDTWTWPYEPPRTNGIEWGFLPEDFYKVNAVAISTDLIDRRPLVRLPSYTEEWLRGEEHAGEPEYYNIRGKYLELFPRPGRHQYSIHMNYVPTAPVLVEDEDTFDGINGWEEYPAVYAARRMSLKDMDVELVNLQQQELNKLTARIKGLASDRDIGQAKRVQDTRGALAWRTRFRRRLPRPAS